MRAAGALSDERDLDAVFARLPRVRNLNVASQAIARELVAWREQTAAARTAPCRACSPTRCWWRSPSASPAHAKQLHDIRGAAQSSVRRRAEEVLEAVRRGRERPHEPLTGRPRHRPPDPDDAPLVALAEALVRARTQEADLAYELVAARADLQAIVTAWRAGGDEADVRTLRGWRRELVGAELLELLDGAVSLSVRDGRLHIA